MWLQRFGVPTPMNGLGQLLRLRKWTHPEKGVDTQDAATVARAWPQALLGREPINRWGMA